MPKHVKPTDHRNEVIALKEFIKQIGDGYYRHHANNDTFPYDATLYGVDEQPYAIVEVKRRNNPMRKYADYRVDKAKVDRLVHEAQRLSLMPLLLVHFTDHLALLDIEMQLHHATEGWIRRWDRNDPNDEDKCYCFTPNLFMEIGKGHAR